MDLQPEQVAQGLHVGTEAMVEIVVEADTLAPGRGVFSTPRMVELMETYRDRPMDLADASVVAAAEHLGMRRLFALDRDFYIYRLADGSTLEVVP